MVKYAYIEDPPHHLNDVLEKGYAKIIVPNCNNGYRKFCNASGVFEEYYGSPELPDIECEEKPTKVNVLMEAAEPDFSSHANLQCPDTSTVIDYFVIKDEFWTSWYSGEL